MSDVGSLAQRWFTEVWNERRLESADALAAPGCLGHLEGGDTEGVDEWKRTFSAFLSAFPDIHVTVEDVVAEGSRAAVRWRAAGTHTGLGLPVAPAGRRFDVRGTTWFRFDGGKIVEAWDCWNLDGLLASLARPAA